MTSSGLLLLNIALNRGKKCLTLAMMNTFYTNGSGGAFGELVSMKTGIVKVGEPFGGTSTDMSLTVSIRMRQKQGVGLTKR